MRGTRDWLGEALRNALVLLRLGWEHGGRWARLAIRYTAVVIVGLPIALTLAALTGIHALTGLVIFAAFAALGWVVWAITQPRYQDYLAMGLVVTGGVATIDKLGDIRKVVESGLRGLRILLLVEIGIGAYFFFVPIENNRELVLGIPILAALMLFSLGFPRGWRLIFFWLPAIVLVGLTLHFFSKEPWYQNWQAEKAKAAPAEVQPDGKSTTTVTLRGPDQWVSTGINLNQLPAGLHYFFYGPTGTKVRFVDEDGNLLAEGLITQDFGVQGGTPEFAGVTGETATLQVAS